MTWLPDWFGRKDEEAAGPNWAPFFSARDYLHFVELVEAELSARKIPFTLGDGTVQVTLNEGEPHEWGLQNLAQLCFQSGEEAWRQVISHHVGNLLAVDAQRAEIDRLMDDFACARPALRIRLYPDDVGLCDASSNLVAFTPAPGIHAVLCFDLPTVVVSVARDRLEKWGVAEEELFELALQNVRAEGPLNHRVHPLQNGATVDALLGESHYTASHALFLDEYVPKDLSSGAIVAVPHRHMILFHPIRDLSVMTAVQTLIPMAQGIYAEGPGSVSPNLYWWRPEGMVRLDTEFEDGRAVFRPPEAFTELLQLLAAPRA